MKINGLLWKEEIVQVRRQTSYKCFSWDNSNTWVGSRSALWPLPISLYRTLIKSRFNNYSWDWLFFSPCEHMAKKNPCFLLHRGAMAWNRNLAPVVLPTMVLHHQCTYQHICSRTNHGIQKRCSTPIVLAPFVLTAMHLGKRTSSIGKLGLIADKHKESNESNCICRFIHSWGKFTTRG